MKGLLAPHQHDDLRQCSLVCQLFTAKTKSLKRRQGTRQTKVGKFLENYLFPITWMLPHHLLKFKLAEEVKRRLTLLPSAVPCFQMYGEGRRVKGNNVKGMNHFDA